MVSRRRLVCSVFGPFALARRFSLSVCDHDRAWQTSTQHWKCVSCGRKTSVTAGTIFHRTRTPLSTWFAAIWLVTSQKNGASAKNLHDMLAWAPTRPRGHGCTSCAARWCAPIASCSPMWSKSTSPSSGPRHRQARRLHEQSTRHDCGGKRWYTSESEASARSSSSRRRRLPRVETARRLRPNHRCTRLADSHRRRPDVSRPGQRGLQTRVHLRLQLTRTRARHPARAAPSGLATQTVERRHPSLPRRTRTPAVLPRRVHLPFNRRRSTARGMLFYRLLQQSVNTDPHPLHELISRTPKPNVENDINREPIPSNTYGEF